MSKPEARVECDRHKWGEWRFLNASAGWARRCDRCGKLRLARLEPKSIASTKRKA